MFSSGEITVADNVAECGAALIAEALRAGTAEGKHTSTVLAGGTTFRGIYARLACQDIAWEKADFFFGDERQVPREDGRSNYRMVEDQLSGRWKPQNVYPLDDSADYGKLLESYLDRHNLFDVTLLGIGPDGHTASLFPAERARWEGAESLVLDTAAGLEPLVARRTLSPRALSRSRLLLVVATGKEKADIVSRIVADTDTYPISTINPIGKKLLLLDSASSSLLGM